jgi:hypothetical protein
LGVPNDRRNSARNENSPIDRYQQTRSEGFFDGAQLPESQTKGSVEVGRVKRKHHLVCDAVLSERIGILRPPTLHPRRHPSLGRELLVCIQILDQGIEAEKLNKVSFLKIHLTEKAP